MTFIEHLRAAELAHQSRLCVGLDPEPSRFPVDWKNDSRRIFDFCAAIADATADLVLAFKPQIAYFAAHRAEEQLEALMHHLRKRHPQVPVISFTGSTETGRFVGETCGRMHKRLSLEMGGKNAQIVLDDANLDVIRNRLQVYDQETKPVLDFYGPDVVHDINATQTPIEVLTDILRILAKL